MYDTVIFDAMNVWTDAELKPEAYWSVDPKYECTYEYNLASDWIMPKFATLYPVLYCWKPGTIKLEILFHIC